MKFFNTILVLVVIAAFIYPSCTPKISEQTKVSEPKIEPVNNSIAIQKVGKPIMSFDKRMVDIGKIKRGEKRNLTFYFTNIGDVPLEIDVISSCNCTKVEYPHLPVLSGKDGKLEVTFDSTEKEKSETVDIDVILKNIDPKTNDPIIELVQYKFELEE